MSCVLYCYIPRLTIICTVRDVISSSYFRECVSREHPANKSLIASSTYEALGCVVSPSWPHLYRHHFTARPPPMGFTFGFFPSVEGCLAAGETAYFFVKNKPAVAVTLVLGILIAVVTSVFFQLLSESVRKRE